MSLASQDKHSWNYVHTTVIVLSRVLNLVRRWQLELNSKSPCAEKHLQSGNHAFRVANDSSPWNWEAWITTRCPVQQYTLHIEAELNQIQRSGYTPPKRTQVRLLLTSAHRTPDTFIMPLQPLRFWYNIHIFRKMVTYKVSPRKITISQIRCVLQLYGFKNFKAVYLRRPCHWKKGDIPPPTRGLRHCKLNCWQRSPSIHCY